MPKTKKLSTLKQIHGKIDSKKPTCLDDVWGFDKLSKYETVDEAVYIARLKDMTRADLEAHAVKMGCMVLESSERLRAALLKQFQFYVSSLNPPTQLHPGRLKISADVQKILNEGR